MGARPLPDVAKYGEACRSEVEGVIQACIEGLKAGENLLLYPSGHLAHGCIEDLGGASAVETILAKAPEVRVVLVHTRGLWGSCFSWAAGRPPRLLEALRKGTGCLLANFLFFSPRRAVSLELKEFPDLPRGQGRVALNRFMEAYYNQDPTPNTYVPYTLWEGGGPRVLPEPEPPRLEGDVREVPAATRDQVLAQLREMTGRQEIGDGHTLARDLGMDSLGRMELQLWLEREFGYPDIDPESLVSVADVLLAACGRTVGAGAKVLEPVPPAWFRKAAVPVAVPPGGTLTEAFLAQAARGPDRVLAADQRSGAKTFRDVLAGILVLRPRFAALPGEYVGLMLPASAGVSTLYLALLFAGKVPVMVNWTVGSRNLVHGLDLLGVRHVVTSSQLVARVEAQGVDLSSVKDRFLSVEEIGRSPRPGSQAPGLPEGPVLLAGAAQGPGAGAGRGALHQRQRKPAQGRAAHPREPAGQPSRHDGPLRLQPRRADDRHPAPLPLLRAHLHGAAAVLRRLPRRVPPQPHRGGGAGQARRRLPRDLAGGHAHLPAGHRQGRRR